MKLEERICHADGTCLRTGIRYIIMISINSINFNLIIFFQMLVIRKAVGRSGPTGRIAPASAVVGDSSALESARAVPPVTAQH